MLFFYKKPGEGPSSKSFLFLAKNFLFSFLIFLLGMECLKIKSRLQ